MRRLVQVIVVLVLVFSACSSSKNKSSKESKVVENQKSEVIYFQRTSCNGRCPAYVFKLYSDLSCELDVKLFFIVEGKNKGEIAKADYDALLKKMEAIDFFSLNNNYNDTMVHDIPATIVGFTKNGKSKKIKCVINTPEQLIQLNSEIEDLIKKIAWKKEE